MTEAELEFLFKLVVVGLDKDKLKKKAAEIFWKISILEVRGYSKAIVEPSRKHLVDLIKSLDNSFKDLYIINCIEIINKVDEQRSSTNALIILCMILKTYPTYTGYGHLSKQT